MTRTEQHESDDPEGPEEPVRTGSDHDPHDSVSELLRDSGISAGVIALLVILRIMAVSEWRWRTAATVTETVDLGDIAMIALGTLFEQKTLTGLALVVLLPLTVVRLAVLHGRRQRERIPLTVFALVQLAIAFPLVYSEGQWWLPVGVVGIAAVLWAGRHLGRRDLGRVTVTRITRRLGLIAVAVTLILAAAVPTPWVPHEVIRTTNGVVAGYVLEDASGTLKVLVPGDHELVIVTAGEVVSREVTDR